MKSVKRFLGVLLTFIFLFMIAVQPSGIKAEGAVLPNIEILENNDQVIKLKTTIDGVVGILTQDQDTLEITLDTIDTNISVSSLALSNEKGFNIASNEIKRYELTLNDSPGKSSEDNYSTTYQDVNTGEEFTVNSDSYENSGSPGTVTPFLVWLLPIGAIIGEILISHLLAMATAVIIGSITWAVAEAVTTKLREEKHDHYAARIMQQQVWIGPSISLAVAKARLISFNGDADAPGSDVFSRTLSLAVKVAKEAGGGKEPVGPEIHGPLGGGFLYHYHTWNRVGGHSFF